ncbi:MAG: ketoacyl-ACP synthase III [Opitutaceae bacterium]|nr:ketoacyl-ACP synthase III [Opitutaceae bacterium]
MNPAGQSVVILGTGAYVPERILTNDELTRIVDTTDEWILTRSGIRERHVAAPDQATSDLAVEAARVALADAKLTPADIDLLIIATCTPDAPLPSTATLVHQKLGLGACACFDLAAACSGFLYSLETAEALLRTGRYRHALVIGAEKLTSLTDYQDRTTCILFGDGAGAVVLGLQPGAGTGIVGTKLYADGSASDLIKVTAGGSRRPPSAESVAQREHFIQMRGKEVFKLAVTAMQDAAIELLEKNGVAPDQVKLLIPHQANQRIIDAIAQRMKLPADRVFMNLERYGNTSAASIPIALDEARRSGRIVSGDYVLLVAFGAGLTWASALIRWI